MVAWLLHNLLFLITAELLYQMKDAGANYVISADDVTDKITQAADQYGHIRVRFILNSVLILTVFFIG